MGCYLVPTAAFLLHKYSKRNQPANKHSLWLQQLLLGGAVFGIIDHAWNGELFLFGEKILMDLLLGVAITVGIYATWGFLVWRDKAAQPATA